MQFKEQYDKKIKKFLSDNRINKDNRELFKKFFEWEEHKLKRQNSIAKLDEACYKTLYGYIIKLNVVNGWFKNKAWVKLTKEDIKKVYEDLEDDKILNARKKPFRRKYAYYNKILKSKPFELAGKDDIAREVIEFTAKRENEEVRFIEIETFKKIVNVVIQPEHKLLVWLAFDIGENVLALLQLQKKDFFRRYNEHTKEPEYLINLPSSKIKRSRVTRSELTNFKETTEYADIVLANMKDEDLIFPFGYRNAKKILDRAVKIVNAKCIPQGQKVTFKDLRSSMACYLLNTGWTTDEINKRLGHKPSSRELDKYVNFFSIKGHETKKKLYDNDLRKVLAELETNKEAVKKQAGQIEELKTELKETSSQTERALKMLEEIKAGKAYFKK